MYIIGDQKHSFFLSLVGLYQQQLCLPQTLSSNRVWHLPHSTSPSLFLFVTIISLLRILSSTIHQSDLHSVAGFLLFSEINITFHSPFFVPSALSYSVPPPWTPFFLYADKVYIDMTTRPSPPLPPKYKCIVYFVNNFASLSTL